MSPFITARGIAIAFPMALSKAAPLCQNPLAYALDLVKKAKDQMGAEKVSSLTDLMVLKGRSGIGLKGTALQGRQLMWGSMKWIVGGGGPTYGWLAGIYLLLASTDVLGTVKEKMELWCQFSCQTMS
ncbi:hypothetical protein ACSQ67_003385 [Phaseolus vulgaris]